MKEPGAEAREGARGRAGGKEGRGDLRDEEIAYLLETYLVDA